jgi:hypothetical protein
MNDNHTTLQMFLTTAVVAAFAAILAGSASAYVMDVEGGGGSGSATVAAQPQVEPGTIPYLSQGIGVDQSLFAGAAVADELDPAIRTAMQARESSANVTKALTEKGPIPYLSNGIGVDQSLFQGEQHVLGLTGDSPIARVVSVEPEALTGDSPRTRGDILEAHATLAAADGDLNWTWVGFGAGMAALLAAAMTALYLSARNRDRVALP